LPRASRDYDESPTGWLESQGILGGAIGTSPRLHCHALLLANAPSQMKWFGGSDWSVLPLPLVFEMRSAIYKADMPLSALLSLSLH